MIRSKLTFINKPDPDYFKQIQANAKFKTLADVVRTKVGINSFYQFDIAIESSLVMRDIILNSPYVSGWARSSQVLNDTDSTFDVYKPFHDSFDSQWQTIKAKLEDYERLGYSMDNMRTLIPVYSLTDYAISVNLLTLMHLVQVLENITKQTKVSMLASEAFAMLNTIANILKQDYNLDPADFNFKSSVPEQFQSLETQTSDKLKDLTGLDSYHADVTYSVLGQIFRHRTVYKCMTHNTKDDYGLAEIKVLTENQAYDQIGIPAELANCIIEQTSNAATLYEVCQGSIIPITFNGTPKDIYKMLSQRLCYINDTPHFKSCFDQYNQTKAFKGLELVPPCKMNAACNGCYVDYVNRSRLKGEEKTQIPCPVWSKENSKDGLELSLNATKSKWYYENSTVWGRWYRAIKGEH